MRYSVSRLVFGFALAGPCCVLLAGEGTLKTGPWGGDKVALEVVADGATVEFECAHGQITRPVKLDANGDFDLPGTFSPEGHGPTRDDADSASEARYQGHVEGDTLTLNIRHGDERLGPYSLTRGRQPILRKCR